MPSEPVLAELPSPSVLREQAATAEEPSQPTRRTSRTILTACALVALPVGYLVLRSTGSPQAASVSTAPAPSITALEAANAANPTVDNRINLSQAYINGNAMARAVPILESVIQSDPNNLIAWNNLCVAHIKQQDYKPALMECARAVQIDPSYALARNNLKWAQDENDKVVKALAVMEQTSPAARDVKFYMNEGMQYLHIGNYDQSIHAWQQVLVLEPNNAVAANNIGTSYMFQNQPETGLRWFRKSLAADPGLQVAQNNIAWANDELAKQK